MGQNADLGAVVFLRLGQPRTWRQASEERACPQRRTGPTTVRRFSVRENEEDERSRRGLGALPAAGATQLPGGGPAPPRPRLYAEAGRISFEAPLASRSPVYAASQRRRWTTQHPYWLVRWPTGQVSLHHISTRSANAPFDPSTGIGQALVLI